MSTSATIIIFFFMLFSLLALIFAAEWRIFSKAGEPGWKALIPGYNTYVHYKVSTLKRPLMHTIVSAVLSSLNIIASRAVLLTEIYNISSTLSHLSRPIIYFGLGLPVAILGGISLFKLAKAFGQSTGFAVGLILLPLVFQPILGFGKAQYTAGAGVVPGVSQSGDYPEGLQYYEN